MNKLLVYSLTLLSISVIFTPVFGQTSQSSINWLQLCRNPIVDAVVTEPCETLSTPDGYTLTHEGERVVACFLGAGLLLAVDPTGKALAEAQALASTTGLWGGGSLSQPPSMQQPVQPPLNTQEVPSLPPNTQVTDSFEVHVTEIGGSNITTSVYLPSTSSRLESTDAGHEDLVVPFNFYAGFAPIGSLAIVCVKNNNALGSSQQICQNVTHRTNPVVVNIKSP